MRHFASSFALALALALAAPPTPAARAQDAAEGDDARTLFQRGQAAYAQGDYDAAISAWERAYGLDPRPLLQFNLSQAFERMGRLQDAVDALALYLERADPQDEHQADARARQASLRERIARTSVRIVGGPEGATILIDDEDRGRTPRPDPMQVTEGSHRIVVRLDGYQDFHSTIVVPAGQVIDVPLDMTRASSVSREPATSSGGGMDFTVPAILWGVGGAALIAGAVLGGVALGQAESAPSSASPEADTARGLAIGADVLIPVGAAAVVAGLIVLLVSGSGDGESDTATLTIEPYAAPGAAGVRAGARF